jgi:hypothetical protein
MSSPINRLPPQLPPSAPSGARTNVRAGTTDRNARTFSDNGANPPKLGARGTMCFGRDVPGVYVRNVRAVVSSPPPGTSNTAHGDLVGKYGAVFEDLVRQGPGSQTLGTAKADRGENNSFDITGYPEESLNNVHVETYHKYGLLTYFGPVDEKRGYTKEFLIREVLYLRFSYPGYQLCEVKANFVGRSQVFIPEPALLMADVAYPRFISPIKNDGGKIMADPKNHTHHVGDIEQMKVPDGVLNITVENHEAYPGTIRRVFIERNGGLFLFTSGAGENSALNTGVFGVDRCTLAAVALAPLITLPNALARSDAQFLGALGNDYWGVRAFRKLDSLAFAMLGNGRLNHRVRLP